MGSNKLGLVNGGKSRDLEQLHVIGTNQTDLEQIKQIWNMDPCWKELPIEIAEYICNFLPKMRRIDATLSEEIRSQMYKFDRWYFNSMSMFGFENAYQVMYDDLRHITHVPDIYPEEMPIEDVVTNMWKTLTPEQRDEILMSY